jgi:hypothetical protein
MVFLLIYCRNLVKPECYTAEVAMCFTTAALIRKGDVLGAIGEHGLEGASAYSWLIDSGVTHSMTPHRSNYATFTRGTLSITVGTGRPPWLKGIATFSSIYPIRVLPQNFLLKDVWYVPELDCNPPSVPQLLSQGIATVFAAQGGALLKGGQDYRINRYLRVQVWATNGQRNIHRASKSLAVSNLATTLAAKGQETIIKDPAQAPWTPRTRQPMQTQELRHRHHL